jgi:hypothetical protein
MVVFYPDASEMAPLHVEISHEADFHLLASKFPSDMSDLIHFLLVSQFSSLHRS